MLAPPPTSSARALGLDLVETGRLQAAWDRFQGRLLHRLFHSEELAYCLVPARATALQRLAGRFAVKEAVFKALGGGLYAWHDVCVGVNEQGAPVVQLSGRSAERASQLGIRSWLVSITHTRAWAAAVVIGT